MASTYVNDLRLNEMATGDASGTWGTTTNTNLELIGEALGYGTEAITTNADTHTSTIADGATDPVRAMFVKYTGSLDSACTITIAPNTVNRMHFIENGTSGSQNIIISQGSGANITIPPGDTKAVYLDGAGSGAAVVDAFASLSTVDLKVQDDLTVTDDATIGGTLGVTGVLTATSLDISGDIDVDGTSNLDVVDIDGAVDMASTLQVDGSITSSAEMTLTRADNGVNLSLVSTDADEHEGPGFVLYRNSSSPADNDALGFMYFQGENDADQKVTYAIVAGFMDDVSDGTEDGILRFNTTVAGTSRNRMDITPAATVFNEDSVDVDFRVESNGDGHMLFVDAGNDKVGVGVSAPSATLDVRNSSGTDAEAFISVGNSDGSKFLGLYSGRLNNALPTIFADSTSTRIRFAFADDNAFGSGFAEEMALFPNGKLGIGSSPTNLTDEVISISTPASGGGHGISFKRLDTNTDQVVGQIRFSNNSTDDLAFIKTKTDGANTSSAIQFFTNTGSGVAEKARIDSSGRLLVGTTSVYSDANDKFVVNGGRSNFTASEISSGAFNRQTSTGDIVAFLYNGSGKGSISTDGSNIAYNTSSDARLKNILGEAKGLDIVSQLNPVNFEWKESGKTQDGLIAQEVESLIPEAVSTNEYTGFYEMDYSKLVTPLIKAIQEQQTTIENLTARLNTLEG